MSCSGSRATLTAPAWGYRSFPLTGRAQASESYPLFSASSPRLAQDGLKNSSSRPPNHTGPSASGNLDARVEPDPHSTAPDDKRANPHPSRTPPGGRFRRCLQGCADRVAGRLMPLRVPTAGRLVIPAGQRAYGPRGTQATRKMRHAGVSRASAQVCRRYSP